jgi:hypothetical protein
MITPDFVTAGNATFTIEPAPAYLAGRPECKPHYTYRVSRKPATERWGETWFVSLLAGQDNTADYAYLGILDATAGAVRLTARSPFGPDACPVKIVSRVLAALWAGNGGAVEAAGWKVHHEGRCGRCGRALTVPESVESGIGPECARRTAAA